MLLRIKMNIFLWQSSFRLSTRISVSSSARKRIYTKNVGDHAWLHDDKVSKMPLKWLHASALLPSQPAPLVYITVVIYTFCRACSHSCCYFCCFATLYLSRSSFSSLVKIRWELSYLFCVLIKKLLFAKCLYLFHLLLCAMHCNMSLRSLMLCLLLWSSASGNDADNNEIRKILKLHAAAEQKILLFHIFLVYFASLI